MDGALWTLNTLVEIHERETFRPEVSKDVVHHDRKDVTRVTVMGVGVGVGWKCSHHGRPVRKRPRAVVNNPLQRPAL